MNMQLDMKLIVEDLFRQFAPSYLGLCPGVVRLTELCWGQWQKAEVAKITPVDHHLVVLKHCMIIAEQQQLDQHHACQLFCVAGLHDTSLEQREVSQTKGDDLSRYSFRWAHMGEAVVFAAKVLPQVASLFPGFTVVDFNEIEVIIALHDSLSVRRAVTGNLLLQLFCETDSLAMIARPFEVSGRRFEKVGPATDLWRGGQDSPPREQLQEQLHKNLKSLAKRARVYPSGEALLGGTMFKNTEAYRLYQAYTAAWEQDLAYNIKATHCD